jgi:(1->4)-alpha-D-glucan 1-alpha-D-glucosylmutase
MAAEGSKATHLFAFARRDGEAAAVVAVPRLVARLSPDPGRPPIGAESWLDTRLSLAGLDPALRWRNAFTGELLTPEDRDGQPSLPAAGLFADFPVSLLIAERGD